ncbi:hypothetical protein JKP88DRAFT_332304, partial [Tribonema minus]
QIYVNYVASWQYVAGTQQRNSRKAFRSRYHVLLCAHIAWGLQSWRKTERKMGSARIRALLQQAPCFQARAFTTTPQLQPTIIAPDMKVPCISPYTSPRTRPRSEMATMSLAPADSLRPTHQSHLRAPLPPSRLFLQIVARKAEDQPPPPGSPGYRWHAPPELPTAEHCGTAAAVLSSSDPHTTPQQRMHVARHRPRVQAAAAVTARSAHDTAAASAGSRC